MRDMENIMKEWQELKRVQIDQNSDQDTDSNTLSLGIQAKVVPLTLKVPKEKFDGTTNSIDHVAAFESNMDLYGAFDAVKGQAFLATFRGVARSWYDSLPSQTIMKFKQFKRLFVGHFMAKKEITKKV